MTTVNTIADLRLISGTTVHELVLLLGYYTPGDKPPLYYLWETADYPYTDDLGSVIVPTGSTTGAWVANLGREILADHFGVRYNNEGSTDALNNAIDYVSKNGGGKVYLSIGNVVARVFPGASNVKLIGAGTDEAGGIYTKISAITSTGSPVRVEKDNFELHNLILSGVNPSSTSSGSAVHTLRVLASNFICSNVIAEEVASGDTLYIANGASNLKFFNSKFRYAARCACSIVDGHDIYFENCDFVQGTETQPYLYIFDAEPKPDSEESVYNLHLKNCKIVREGEPNGNSTFILKSQLVPNTMNVVIEKCEFSGATIRINSDDFRGLFVYDSIFSSGFIANPSGMPYKKLLYGAFKRNIFNAEYESGDPLIFAINFTGDVIFEENIFNGIPNAGSTGANTLLIDVATFHTNRSENGADPIVPIDRTSDSIQPATTVKNGSVKQLPSLDDMTATVADVINTMKSSGLMEEP